MRHEGKELPTCGITNRSCVPQLPPQRAALHHLLRRGDRDRAVSRRSKCWQQYTHKCRATRCRSSPSSSTTLGRFASDAALAVKNARTSAALRRKRAPSGQLNTSLGGGGSGSKNVRRGRAQPHALPVEIATLVLAYELVRFGSFGLVRRSSARPARCDMV
jgi:hypothetical protein